MATHTHFEDIERRLREASAALDRERGVLGPRAATRSKEAAWVKRNTPRLRSWIRYVNHAPLPGRPAAAEEAARQLARWAWTTRWFHWRVLALRIGGVALTAAVGIRRLWLRVPSMGWIDVAIAVLVTLLLLTLASLLQV